jgi:hypothetical protein
MQTLAIVMALAVAGFAAVAAVYILVGARNVRRDPPRIV